MLTSSLTVVVGVGLISEAISSAIVVKNVLNVSAICLGSEIREFL